MLSEENYSLATFCVIVRQLCYVNKGQAVWFGLAWLPAVCENNCLKSIRKTKFTKPVLIMLEFCQFLAHSSSTKTCEIKVLIGLNTNLLEMISAVSFDLWSRHFSQSFAAVYDAELKFSINGQTLVSTWSYLSFQYSSNS